MSEQQTVYVVFSGYYSDKGVEAVFSTEEAAKQYCEVRGHRDKYRLELYYNSYELDPLDRIATGRIWHRVDFDYEGGLEEIKTINEDDAPLGFVPEKAISLTARTVSGKQWLRVWVEARDPEQAVKIAAEKRAEYLAEQAGIS